MVYQVPPSKASIKQNRFEFQLPGSKKTYSVPQLQFVKPSLALKFGEMTEVQVADALFTEYLPEVFPLLEDGSQLEALLNAWKDASEGVGVGESSASADS
jgi:hypothetical protein